MLPHCLRRVWVPAGVGCSSYLSADCNYMRQCRLGEPGSWCLLGGPVSLSLKLEKPRIHFPQVTFESAARSKVLLPLNKGAAIPKVQSNLKYQISNEPWPQSSSSLCTWLNLFLPAGSESTFSGKWLCLTAEQISLHAVPLFTPDPAGLRKEHCPLLRRRLLAS